MSVIAHKIAAELTPMYVRDGTSERFEPVNMARVVEHILILFERQQPEGAVCLSKRNRQALKWAADGYAGMARAEEDGQMGGMDADGWTALANRIGGQ